jgi:hypothetical protein
MRDDPWFRLWELNIPQLEYALDSRAGWFIRVFSGGSEKIHPGDLW